MQIVDAPTLGDRLRTLAALADREPGIRSVHSVYADGDVFVYGPGALDLVRRGEHVVGPWYATERGCQRSISAVVDGIDLCAIESREEPLVDGLPRSEYLARRG